MPDLIVTAITVIALWIPDINSRTGLSVTALLMVIAVMWTITGNLPMTEYSTWMTEFSTFCIIIIGLCCLENAIVAYAQTKIGVPPKWMKYFIDASNIFSIIYRRSFLFFVDHCCDFCCICYGYFYPVPKRRKRRKRNNVTASDIEMNSVNYDKNIDNSCHEVNIDNIENNNNHTLNPISEADLVQSNQEDQGQQHIPNKVEENKQDDKVIEVNEDFPLLGTNGSLELSWIRVGRSVDRISRVMIPFAFSIGTIKLLSDARN